MLWNTLYMTAAVERLKQHGYPVLEEDLARLSPLIYEHINMLGRYSADSTLTRTPIPRTSGQ
nr:transposase [Pseudomonas alcaligenes]